MSTTSRRIAILGIFGLLTAAVGGCGDSKVVVARVAGSPISASMVSHWAAVDAAVEGKPVVQQTSRQRALSFLIASRWLLGEATEVGAKASDAQVQKQLQLLAYDQIEKLPYEGLPRDPQLRKYLTSSKVRSADRAWLMKLMLLAAQIERQRFSRARHEVSRQQIADFYEQHKRRFWLPERRDLEIFESFTRPPIIKAKREVESGKSFLSVARRMSKVTFDPEAPKGLLLGLARGDEEKPFERVIFAAKPHVLIGPIEYAYFYVFKVLRVKLAHESPLAQVAERIRQSLARQRAAGKLVADYAQKWSARTSCRPGYRVATCRRSATDDQSA